MAQPRFRVIEEEGRGLLPSQLLEYSGDESNISQAESLGPEGEVGRE